MNGVRSAGLRRILSGELPTTNFWDIPHERVHSDRDEFRTDAAYDDWRWGRPSETTASRMRQSC
jgi:hypothetical protein